MEYSKLVDVYLELEKTTKKLEKRDIIASFLKKVNDEDLNMVIYLLQGKFFPDWNEEKIGISDKLILKTVSKATGYSNDKVISLWKEYGNLGRSCEELMKSKKQGTLHYTKLNIKKVYDNIVRLPSFEGSGTVDKKIGLVVELINNSSPIESRFIVNSVLENLRVGVAAGIIRDAISVSYDTDVKNIEKSYNLTLDYGEVALLAKKKKLSKIGLESGRPIKLMLAIKVDGVEEAFKAVGKPAQAEYKLDGFRLQIHKSKEGIKFFTRNFENVTKQFQELVEVVDKNVKGKNFILDGEVVGYDVKTGKYLPFQSISQRIKRKYDIKEMAKKFPVVINLFDVIYYNNKNLMDENLKKRRKILEKITKEVDKKIMLTKKLVSDDVKKITKFYKEALSDGTEGLIVKNIESGFKPGRYVNGWVKLKQTLEPLDLVITKAEWGEGKRANWLSSFTIACLDKGKILEVGKVSTGVKEKSEGLSFEELTNVLKKHIIKEEGKSVVVDPKIVIEVGYEEIQKSPTYSSGYALRFPRLLRLRHMEKSSKDINNLQDIERLYQNQRGKR
ncbi:ATP-dependent DNA ligase [archaeon]|nr:ATP-dependent DNA ligase [archaeon]